MCNIEFFDILNTIDKFMKELSGFLFFDALIFNDVVKELPILHILHDKHELFGRFDDLVQLDKVGVAN